MKGLLFAAGIIALVALIVLPVSACNYGGDVDVGVPAFSIVQQPAYLQELAYAQPIVQQFAYAQPVVQQVAYARQRVVVRQPIVVQRQVVRQRVVAPYRAGVSVRVGW